MARILIVEDEEAVREFVSRVLTMHGHSVLIATDGAAAVELMTNHHFDLLLSDIAMPMMDGISLALKVRSERPHIPILLMTGFADERQRAHNLSLLIEGLLTKPFNMEQLLSEVNKALSKFEVEDYASVESQSGTVSSAISSSTD
ncbi:response regulator [Kordiimonas sp. SCSIO 12603]|uniref:response regulator n=1 Tax=Kordiimonas sp. SCSIO 12603 TaxID=2829596 RepID=UPI002107B6C2|nr:response regulator [Kordiimonas sp. SCSIO 12603]UTW58488.1 response regulator [Kordiimonas sp. SCSIO 12603]